MKKIQLNIKRIFSCLAFLIIKKFKIENQIKKKFFFFFKELNKN